MLWDLPLPNLPVFLPGETLYSWCGAVHASNGNADVRKTSEQLYGDRSAALLHDFPSYLNSLDAKLEHCLGAPRELALKRTLLGYFLASQPHANAARLLEAVCVGRAPHLKLELGISASRVGGHHFLKGCEHCFDAQEADPRVGRAYWRLDHQYPSVFLCSEHDMPLRTAWDSVTPVHRRGWLLPRMGLDRHWRELPQLTSGQFNRLRRLADFSVQWAALEPASVDMRVLAATYRAALGSLAMATEAGNLRLSKVVPYVVDYYRGLEGLPGMQVLGSLRSDWPGLVGNLARRAPRHGHPLKHLVLIAMLFEDWGTFWKAYQYEAYSAASPPLNAEAAVEPANGERLLLFKELITREGLSVTAAAAQVGVSATTGVRWAKRAGMDFSARPKTLTPPRLRSVRRLLLQGMERRAISERTGVSVSSINRLVSSEKELALSWKKRRHGRALTANRARFMEIVRAHPDWTIKQIRRTRGNGYMWLYRNDRPWLLDHLPSLFASPEERQLALNS